MSIKIIKTFSILVLLSLSLILAACDNLSQMQEPPTASAQERTMAMVDAVSVEESNAHKYAAVNGNYPDACTKISKVEQSVEGNSFNITLYTDKPADLMCAQMISPFTVSILLEVGGKAPGDYTVDVNNTVSTTFSIGG